MSALRHTIAVSLGCALALGACGLVIPAPSDLRIEALRVVELADHPEVRGFRGDQGNHPALLLSLSTSANLEHLVTRHGALPFNEASVCRSSMLDRLRLLETHYITFGSRDAATDAGDRLAEAIQDGAGRYRYHAFLHMQAEESGYYPRDTTRFGIGYDLRREPMDVCFRLYGGSVLGGSFTSNTIRIPAADLRAALGAVQP